MKRFLKVVGWIAAIQLVLVGIFFWSIRVPLPKVDETLQLQNYNRIEVGPNHYKVNNCWLKKNDFGIWEMYLEGDAYERGLIYGVLAKELMIQQEVYFVNQLKEMIPNLNYLNFLKCFIAFFNRNIHEHIPLENLQEIYGISQSFSDEFNFIGPKYYRILNYHAAHDIGHALNDFQMVGCTSFSLNNEWTSDSSLLIGRNFDFTMGDDFAKDKLLVFVKPTTGYGYASYAWAGFTGVVSGINNQGLTVTINASKSDIPLAAKAPISLLAREILQYAATIEEAIAIAKSREIFVSESLLIGSAKDKRSVIIEKTPSKFDVFEPNGNKLVCANHYQSKLFENDSNNLSNIKNSDSYYRFTRMSNLLDEHKPMRVEDAATVLRNTKGKNNKDIGFGNPKAINQLIAHHSIIFKPSQQQFWVSSAPFQLGAYVGYDLHKILSGDSGYILYHQNIAADSLLWSNAYQRFEYYKQIKQRINKFTYFGVSTSLNKDEEKQFIESNPHSYITYMTLGDYFSKTNEYHKAIDYYQQSLQHDVASLNEVQTIQAKINDCEKALQK